MRKGQKYRGIIKLKVILKTLLFYFLIILTSSTKSFSQQNHLYFKSITKKLGLPDNTIKYIFQDSKGFMWFASSSGLIKFNGYEYKLFQKNSTQNGLQINSQGVNHIMEDNKGQLWISTSGNGINVFNPEQESFTYLNTIPGNSNSVGSNNIHRCFQDSEGNIWIGTLGDGLDLFDPKTNNFTHFKHNPSNDYSIPQNNVTDIIEDKYNNLWIALDGEVITRFDKKHQKFHSYKTNFKGVNLGGYYKHLLFTDSVTLWIATDGTGLFKFDISSKNFSRYAMSHHPDSLNSNYLKGIIEDKSGNLLIISDGGGINYLNIEKNVFTKQTSELSSKNGITTNALYSIYKDKANNIWIGTFKEGLLLHKNNSDKFKIVKQDNKGKGLSHKSVLSMFTDKNGMIWYGTDGGGLNMYNTKTNNYKSFKFAPDNPYSISNNVIKDILEDSDGNLWIATFFEGLNKFDRKSGEITRFQLGNNAKGNISSNNTWCLMEDSKKRLWIGNFSTGLDYYDKTSNLFHHVPQKYKDTTTLSHIQVSSLVEDKDGFIWVGTLEGLNKMNPQTMHCQRFYSDINDTSSLNDNTIKCLYYDSRNRLWIGTEEGGLNLMVRPGEFKSLFSNKKLPSQSIQSIEEDISGYLWISTKNGLVRLDPHTEDIINFNNIEDFIGNEFNWNSSATDSLGNLYFGTTEGACIFSPNQKLFNDKFPLLYYTSIRANNILIKANQAYHGNILLDKSISHGGKLTLTPNEKSFTIEFAALEFDKPQKIRYKYKLHGFNKEWVEKQHNERRATYTNLPGGDYIFEVYSTNSNGTWNKMGEKLYITIIPPFYKTTWFKVLAVLLLFSAIGLFERNKFEKQKRKFELKAQIREKEFLKQRNNELKAELTSNTLLIINKNESLNKVKDKLSELNNNTSDKKIVNELVRLIDHQLESDVHWEQFQYNFDQIYANLLSKLKAAFPDLTQANLKMCAYLRLNMSSKEIASLMNITKSGVDKARNRLRKKLNMEPSDDLYDFLYKF